MLRSYLFKISLALVTTSLTKVRIAKLSFRKQVRELLGEELMLVLISFQSMALHLRSCVESLARI